ncbi:MULTISPECIES: hypothetical protein [Streptococcus]|jgi:protein of hypothetical function/lipoprotein|uniref:Lipoprotein n=2 Tax=Streptococcus sanguinis TaxID=1305 RepID=A0A427ZLS4_STRSA|nr:MULTISPECIES: hypothetical protein [Streptococcus]RKV84684.1 MAG: hypothetical protein D8H99_41680 [Streptococcus sp.]EGD37445.1 protein of hypothetical function/lipoprotein [Streptococcus sanguinis SK150]MBZ2040793.1 hypothetical protein [Streptococcus sanguinis]MBZ2057682.1 hypothetical protein [Streptococcus sanguinis]MCC3171234.1 putative lipoprotein BUG3 [Streptococcus sanguinis]
MGKRTKIIITTVASIVALVSIGGCAMTQKESNKQDKEVTSSKKAIKDDEEIIKQKQLAYLKDHEQEIIDFVKAQSPKVESVQIDWDGVRWSEASNGTPQGGGEMLQIYGGFNNADSSSWGILIPINDDGTLNMDEMFLSNQLRIRGDLFA